MAEQQNVNDPDIGKGAVEGDGRARDERGLKGNTSLAGQNPHRTESSLIKANDTDFPEPGGSPEHSGEPEVQNNNSGFTRDHHGRPHQQTGVAQRGSTLSHDQPGAMNASTANTLDPQSGSNSAAQKPDVKVGESPERDTVNQDPGHRQKQNQADKKDDPLAA